MLVKIGSYRGNYMKIDITKQPYDTKHFIIYFSKNGKDIGFSLHICEFNKEMESLLYDCKVDVNNEKTGFVFPNSTSYEDVIREAERFIIQYKLDE